MKTLFFDTDVLIDILRGNASTIAQVRALAEQYIGCCSCIVVGEIFSGMKPQEEHATRKLLAGLSKIPVTEEIAELAGRLRYQTKSHRLWLDDCLIAATALHYEGILVTKNVKHYPFKKLAVQRVI